MKSQPLSYSKRDLAVAVHLSALLGWLSVVWPIVLALNLGMLTIAALVGMPIATLCCYLIVAPILEQLMKRPVGWRKAARWGGGVGAIFAVIYVCLDFLRRILMASDPSFSYRIGGGDQVMEIGGVLTPYGVQQLTISAVTIVASGVVIALTIRAVLGPGRSQLSGDFP
ncbi:MAG: hypothetical protein AAF844_16780 [Pseudomonadota bacterium]